MFRVQGLELELCTTGSSLDTLRSLDIPGKYAYGKMLA